MALTAEMIFTGDELLRGDTINTNQAFLGGRFLELGLMATHAVSVEDNHAYMVNAILAGLERRPAVLILSGGLGPTDDDLTREAVSSALGRPLQHHEELLDQIQARFFQLGLRMSDSNRKQALIPEGATPVPLQGTAPGFWLVERDTLVAALPGVPWELMKMWKETVEPLVRARLEHVGPAERSLVRRLRVYGIGESSLAEALGRVPWRGETVHVGTRTGLDGITLVLRALGTPEGEEQLRRLEEEVRTILGDKVFGTDDDELAGVVGEMLRNRGLTLATAESCTGGLVAARITDVPGSSDYFLGTIVAYDNRQKTELLNVDPDLLERHGAVSEEVAGAMAVGARRLLGADYALSTTGIAGPGGGTSEKPVGLVYAGLAFDDDVEVRRFTMFRTRREIRERTAQTVLDLLRRRLLSG